MNRNQQKIALSIDIGGTYTKFGLVDKEEGIIEKSFIDTKSFSDKNAFAEALFQKVQLVSKCLTSNSELIGIGVGVPGVSSIEGVIDQAANIPFLKNVNLVSLLEQKFDLPTTISKDSNLAALGEGLFGVAKGMKNYILITLGTGLGCSVVVNNELLIGSSGLAGEFGHAIVVKEGRECDCGRSGCLETYVSSKGIVRTALELMANNKSESELRKISFEDLSPKKIFQAAEKNDAIAIKVFEITGQILGENIANLFTLFDPEAIILTGGLIEAKKYLIDAVIQRVECNTLYSLKNRSNVKISSLAANEAALLGAASLVWNNKNKILI